MSGKEQKEKEKKKIAQQGSSTNGIHTFLSRIVAVCIYYTNERGPQSRLYIFDSKTNTPIGSYELSQNVTRSRMTLAYDYDTKGDDPRFIILNSHDKILAIDLSTVTTQLLGSKWPAVDIGPSLLGYQGGGGNGGTYGNTAVPYQSGGSSDSTITIVLVIVVSIVAFAVSSWSFVRIRKMRAARDSLKNMENGSMVKVAPDGSGTKTPGDVLAPPAYSA